MTDREQLLDLWNDMWKEGNWIPSWPDCLRGLSPEEAAWSPDPNCHSIWQEVVHVTFWRRVTIERMAGIGPPSAEEIERSEFAHPEVVDSEHWDGAVYQLKATHDEIAAAIQDESRDV